MTPILIRTHSPLHIGVGQSPSALDLPITRDGVSGAPMIPGSSLKGALRTRYIENQDDSSLPENDLFGPAVRGVENASAYSGSIVFHDASILFFPVPSPLSGWAWVTSPLALSQLYEYMSPKEQENYSLPKPRLNEAHGAKNLITDVSRQGRFWARDLDFSMIENNQLNQWADWICKQFALDPKATKYIHRRLVCLNDETASLLWRQMSTVVTRNRIDPMTGVVADGALWNEELVPSDTFFISELEAIKSRCESLDQKPNDMIAAITKTCKQFVVGGKVSVGRGLCSLIPMADLGEH